MKEILWLKAAETIQAFDPASRYLDDLLSKDQSYFEGMMGQIYPELYIKKQS